MMKRQTAFISEESRRREKRKEYESREEEESRRRKKREFQENEYERKETVLFMCQLCFDRKPLNSSFKIQGCNHSYCTECTAKYVASQLRNNVTRIRCPVPKCPGFLKPEYCRRILPLKVFERWGNALCEAVILESEKLYCPFKDCSALLVDDGFEDIKESECPHCHRLFCARCQVPWHSGITCEEFQKLNKNDRGREDIMLVKLAKQKEWQQCPKCNFYVEKTEGCNHMKCRCKFSFCYRCGAPDFGYSHACIKH